MKLEIQPLVALCDEKIDIGVSGLKPNSKVKISASMSFPWAKDVLYESFAWFTADSTGHVDLSKQKPDSGSYDFVDSMGLIASLSSKNKNYIKKTLQNTSVNKSMFINIKAECGQDRVNLKLERLLKNPEIKNRRITDEFIGELFYTENPDNQTIVFLGGSGSNLALNSLSAAPLASHGFNVLSVSYFGDKGLPNNISEIPLEYFEKVFDWLSKNPITNSKDVHILCRSKGGELGLILASRYSSIKKVAAFAPHAYCFQGLTFLKNVSSWTYKGKSLPYIRLKYRHLFGNVLSSFIKNEPFGFTHTYIKALDTAKNKVAARIKIENAQAKLLLFATKQNGMWNTYDGCVEIISTLEKHNYQYNNDLVVYGDAGEPALPVPYIFPASIITLKMAPRLAISVGGTIEANVHATADSWEKTIKFFKK